MTELAAHGVQIDGSVNAVIPKADTLTVVDDPSIGSDTDVRVQSSFVTPANPYVTQASINRLRKLGKLMRR